MTHGEDQHSFKQKIEKVVLKRGVGKPELGGLSSYVQFKRIYDKFRKIGRIDKSRIKNLVVFTITCRTCHVEKLKKQSQKYYYKRTI